MGIIPGQFNLSFGTVIIFNDLIWWIPFAWLLADAMKAHAIVADLPDYLDGRICLLLMALNWTQWAIPETYYSS